MPKRLPAEQLPPRQGRATLCPCDLPRDRRGQAGGGGVALCLLQHALGDFAFALQKLTVYSAKTAALQGFVLIGKCGAQAGKAGLAFRVGKDQQVIARRDHRAFGHAAGQNLPGPADDNPRLGRGDDLAAGVRRTSRLACQIVLGAEHEGLTVTIPEESYDMRRR